MITPSNRRTTLVQQPTSQSANFSNSLAKGFSYPQMVEGFNTTDAALKMVRCDQCSGVKSSAMNRRNL